MKSNSYQKLAVTTVIATVVLIFVGGLVRAAGAGLGCPDWPTCFGMWIPPTTADALPAEFNADRFNPYLTWLEYINRLIGVIIGLLITATFAFSFRYRRTDPVITWSAGVAFTLVLFQGWLGGQVVRSGLNTGMITFHMVLAMIIVTVLLFTAYKAASDDYLNIHLREGTGKRLITAGGILLGLVLVQMVLGTQVREMVDIVKNMPGAPPREAWLDQLNSWIYPAHRSFSWFIILAAGLFWWINRSSSRTYMLRVLGNTIVILVIVQAFIGAGMEWFGMPGLFQVLHLTGVALLICAIVLHMLMVGFSNRTAETR
ncbi:MAG: COX15/CtaA family protein [Balneolaceae bacterium]